MSNRRAASSLVVALALLGAACGHPEQKVVDQYFTALNAKDNQTLTSFAAVSLDTKGKRVDSWTIVQGTPEQRTPAPLPELLQKVKEADAAVAENKRKYSAYFLDHPQEVDELRDLTKKGAATPPRLAKTAADWKGFTDTERDLKRAVADAKEAVEREKRLVGLSLGTVDGLEALKGEMASKTLELLLSVGGEAQPHQMTLRRYDLAPAQGPAPMNRWIIYELRPKS